MSDQEHSNDRPVSTEAEGRDELATWADGDIGTPFSGDEYPPAQGFPRHHHLHQAVSPAGQDHLNEETGWVWRATE